LIISVPHIFGSARAARIPWSRCAGTKALRSPHAGGTYRELTPQSSLLSILSLVSLQHRSSRPGARVCGEKRRPRPPDAGWHIGHPGRGAGTREFLPIDSQVQRDADFRSYSHGSARAFSDEPEDLAVLQFPGLSRTANVHACDQRTRCRSTTRSTTTGEAAGNGRTGPREWSNTVDYDDMPILRDGRG
jgi:hypothetical protein